MSTNDIFIEKTGNWFGCSIWNSSCFWLLSQIIHCCYNVLVISSYLGERSNYIDSNFSKGLSHLNGSKCFISSSSSFSLTNFAISDIFFDCSLHIILEIFRLDSVVGCFKLEMSTEWIVIGIVEDCLKFCNFDYLLQLFWFFFTEMVEFVVFDFEILCSCFEFLLLFASILRRVNFFFQIFFECLVLL